MPGGSLHAVQLTEYYRDKSLFIEQFLEGVVISMGASQSMSRRAGLNNAPQGGKI
jgi:hypothetical protein